MSRAEKRNRQAAPGGASRFDIGSGAMEDRSVRKFSGEDEDPGKALRRWRTWALAKLLTMKDMREDQRGPWLFTLLEGKAWDACEHLTLDKLATKDGEKVLWDTLTDRFPEKEAHDLMGEALGEVFSLAASEAETMKQWTARVRETFDKCKRRANVSFPPEARGWIALHCAGLTEEQKAIVKAKTQGNLEFEVLAAALRSCFPLYKAAGGKKKPVGVLQVDAMGDTSMEATADPDDFTDDFVREVEAFISEHVEPNEDNEPVFTEAEAAEALAVSWKQRRKEITAVTKARQLGGRPSSGQQSRAFRVEVEELKKRTKCNRCHKTGHWARECRAPNPVKQNESAGASSTISTVGAGYVQVDDQGDPLPQFVGCITEVHSTTEALSSGLVSSPGYGVVDSGCGRTLIGRDTLGDLEQMILSKGFGPVQYYQCENLFRFGNGATERSTESVRLPVGIAGKFGSIDAAVISGAAPLLLGRPTLEKLKVRLDFSSNSMQLMETTAAMKTNAAGQLLVDILNYPSVVRPSPSQLAKTLIGADDSSQARGTKNKVTLKKKECRCLLAQMQKHSRSENAPVLVAELFSPPRFALEAEKRGYRGLSFDLKTGYNLEDPETQNQVDRLLDIEKPSLLVVCPPCTHRGGWEHLNRTRRSPLETAKLVRQSRTQVKFCEQQIRKQLNRGGEFLFEHPWGSDVWDDSHIVPFKRKYGVRRVDMCAYGLVCPDSSLPIRKATGVLTSARSSDADTFQQCQGCAQHRPVEGKLKSGMNVSEFVAAYTPRFVQKMLDACVGRQTIDSLCAADLNVSGDYDCLIGESELQPASPAETPVAADNPAAGDQADAKQSKVFQALKRLHCNLGHPSNRDLVRILQHSKAATEAIRLAREFECSICRNHQQPLSSLPAKTSRVVEFNMKIGLDVKYLPGWKVNQQAPCVSLVDYATSLHIMAPIFQRETAEILKGVLRDSWISWAGTPQMLEMDPSKPNLSEALGQYCENMGIHVMHTAAESHWQLGKVERHGHWFQKIFQKVSEECPPTSPEEFVENVIQTQIAKNALITESGASPYQLVYGRNPRVPQDLLQEDVHLAASDATEFDSVFQRANAVRQQARLAVLQCQDDKALRSALRARPRTRQEFASGDWVFYWRSQKWQQGQLVKGGRWYGAGMILGRLGVNWIVAHRRSILRCSPEQLRRATFEERAVAEFDASELLGIKTLLEKGQFPKGQFVDLVNQDKPPNPEAVDESHQDQALARTAAQLLQEAAEPPEPIRAEAESSPPSEASVQPEGITEHAVARTRTEEYGPIRRVRHVIKSPPQYLTSKPDQLSRPPVMAQEDFAEMMSDIVPQFLQERLDQSASSSRMDDRGESAKREASTEADDGRPSTRPRTKSALSEGAEVVESLNVESVNVEALTAAFLQKRLQKELPVVGNEPELQEKVDVSKGTEWETLEGKSAVFVWKGAKAAEIKRRFPHRFIGSRFVVTKKKDEEGERVKSRWCLQGHLDPDFQTKIQSGACRSPTLHPLSRALVLQMLVSRKWTMQLGDIKGAFLEAGPIKPQFSPLYAHQPKGGIPGVDPDDVIEVIGNVYGSNDAPFNWWFTFDEEVRQGGWLRSQFDNCLYYLPDPQNPSQICGVLGAHVDDTITGGEGSAYTAAVDRLKNRFPYRKWRVGNGEFCGVMYNQDPQSYEIRYQQNEYASHMRPISLSKDRLRNKDAKATDREIAALRAVNGAANWVSSQSRPDLSVQTSFSQQCFPEPKVRDLLFANQLVHRAKQYSHVEIVVRHIPWHDLCICFHSDAGFGNAKGHKTQAGYIAAFTSSALMRNEPSPWSPFAWKSFKLPRIVASTLAGEAQSFTTASAVAEWMSLMLAEAKQGSFDLRTREQIQHMDSLKGVKCRDELNLAPVVGITDGKSLYDHMTSMSSVSRCDDKRIAIDLAILKQCMSRTGLHVRWCPTELMLADALTKDQQDPADLLRAALAIGEYQLNEEAIVLEKKQAQKQERLERRLKHETREQEKRSQKKQKPKNN